MLIEKSVSVPIGADEVFALISSLDYVATCIPGAKVTGRDGDLYKGELSVKVGPITARYSGTAKLLRLDHDARTLAMRASGKDQGNKGGADAHFTVAVVRQTEADSQLDISADVQLRGLAAQFGRGAIDGIVDSLVDQFAANMAASSQQVTRNAGSSRKGDARPTSGAARSAPQPDWEPPGGDLDALALVRGLVRPQLTGLIVGAACGAVASYVLCRRGRRRGNYVTHAELVNLLWGSGAPGRS